MEQNSGRKKGRGKKIEKEREGGKRDEKMNGDGDESFNLLHSNFIFYSIQY